jgi:hypothetical protein
MARDPELIKSALGRRITCPEKRERVDWRVQEYCVLCKAVFRGKCWLDREVEGRERVDCVA